MAIIDAETVESPRLRELRERHDAGDSTLLEALENELGGRGVALFETAPDVDGEHPLLLTFVWKAESPLRAAVLIADAADAEPTGARMRRLGDSPLWYRTYRAAREDARAYRLVAFDQPVDERWEERITAWELEPLDEPEQLALSREPGDEEITLHVLELPEAPPDSRLAPHPAEPDGRVEEHVFRSALLDNERRVWVYTPPGWDPARAGDCAALIQLDGETYTHLVGVPQILDNLIAEGAIPPVLAVLPDNIDHETRMREFGCNETYVRHLAEELLPWARERWGAGPSGASRTIISGSSMGGLAAAFAGLTAPETFGLVLSQSGSFWWRPKDEPHAWLRRRFEEAPRLPLRFYLDVGLHETSGTPGGGPTQLDVNREMRASLEAKGYALRYQEFDGGHHWGCWKGTLADGLTALLGRGIDPLGDGQAG